MNRKEMQMYINKLLAEEFPELDIHTGDPDTPGGRLRVSVTDQDRNTIDGWYVCISSYSPLWEVHLNSRMQNWGGYPQLARRAAEIHKERSF